LRTLEAEIARLEAAAAIQLAGFERERERCERLMAEVHKTMADLMAAREAAARLAGESRSLGVRGGADWSGSQAAAASSTTRCAQHPIILTAARS
jgi:hypothetical protein